MSNANAVGTEPNAELPAHTVALLHALEAGRIAEDAMQRRARTSMNMGENDLHAIRYLQNAQQEGRTATPADLAAALEMTSASITVMLDRLSRAGHVIRSAHPTDRRSIIIAATPGSHDAMLATFGGTRDRVASVIESLDETRADIIERFLKEMTRAIDTVDHASH